MALPASFLPARRHIAFILGLALAVAVAASLENLLVPKGGLTQELVPPAGAIPPTPVPLAAADLALARAAWAYFPANTRETGLVDTVAAYPGTTMWDSGSALLGLLSARRLNLLPQAEYEARARKLLQALAGLPLVEGGIPNKSYNTLTGQMTNYNNEPAPQGIGWSALDLGRMAVALAATARVQPGLAPEVAKVRARWNLGEIVREGELWGQERRGDGGVQFVQEGRVGYAQYGAKALQLWGLDPWAAYRPEQHLRFVTVQGVRVPADDRDKAKFGAHVYVLSEPYMLLGLELGLSGPERVMATRVFDAQAARHRETGVLTAVSEDHLDRAPFFVYNTVWADGDAWACVTDTGEAHPTARTVSTKAAVALAALFPGDYANALSTNAQELVSPGKGVMAGRYEADGKPNTALTCNTNAIVLEALAYRAHGPILTWSPQ